MKHIIEAKPFKCTPTEPLSSKALNMRVHVRTLQGNFANIATRAADQIHENNVDVQSFRRRFMMQMNVSQRYEYQQFLKCCLMKLEPVTTTDDLLCHLSMYWDFLNYGLLEHTVNIFGDASLKKGMEHYIDNLKAFRVNTKLCDFIDNWPVRGQDPPKADFKRVVIKMGKKWEECTLEDVESFRETLTQGKVCTRHSQHTRLLQIIPPSPTSSNHNYSSPSV